MSFIAVILTYNEEQHLSRCISSIKDVVDIIVVVDCYSTDRTVEIAKTFGAKVIQHAWSNHAVQFNWALSQLDESTDWVLRIDADEYLSEDLANEIKLNLPKIEAKIDGIFLSRRMTFQGKLIHHGGVFPARILRLFRYGRGACENRWMDEHIKVSGKTQEFKGELIDDNLNDLTWWTEKHNRYASREAVDLLNLEYGFMPRDSISDISSRNQAVVKRWIKETVYARLPGGFRSFAYFLYRYILRLGFLDGQAGFAFHFLQGFWYRYLVDAKVAEVKRYMHNAGSDIVQAISHVLKIDVAKRS